MDKKEEISLCVLCCYAFPNAALPSNSELHANLQNFIQNSKLFSTKYITPNSVLRTKGISLCTECLSGIISVVEQKEMVDEMEAQARQFQYQLIYLLKNLRVVIDGYLAEVRKLQEKICTSDDGLVREKIKENQNIPTECGDTLCSFRAAIFNSSSKLETFCDDIMTKFELRQRDSFIETERTQNTDEHNVNDSLNQPSTQKEQLVTSPTTSEPPVPNETSTSMPSSDLQAKPIQENQDTVETSNGECRETYTCTLCPTTSASLMDYNAHLYEKHKMSDKIKITKIENGVEKCDCPHCGKLIERKLYLSHVSTCTKTVHSDNNICEGCGKTCRSQSHLHDHRYYCPETRENKKHIKSHCDICGKRFFKLINLKLHKKRHLQYGVRDKLCDRCGASFSHHQNLNWHLKWCKM